MSNSNPQIHVKTGHGKPNIIMEVQNTDTIIDIKNKILEKYKIPHDQQHIVFSDSREDSKSDLSDIPKLEDAKSAGTIDSKKCTLILTEGDSAKALVMMGLTAIENNKEFYGVFPLQGKPPNASKRSAKENNVIKNLTRILGLDKHDKKDKDKEDEEDEGVKLYDSLRYGNVLLMMDQDYDGSHIKGLVINLILQMWPTLVRTKKFQLLSQFITPIVKATHVDSEVFETFYTLQAFKKWEADQNNDLSHWTIKYYKGLGSISDEEAIDYFKNMDRNKKLFTWEDDSDTKAIDVAFDKLTVEDRKRWINSFESDNYLDIQDKTSLRFKEFIDKEYIFYAVAQLKRNIPSIMDGLVPAQRKILYSSFKKNLVKEIKVNQFIGYVSEECAYHHDEACLAETLIRMGQNFVGANNINLLMPIGQYGTRNLGGKDHASPRYLTTKLNSVTRCLFRNVDEELVEYVNEDGKFVEPEWFLPVIPMVLVNGSRGTGVGWTSRIPKYNPTDIIKNIRRKFQNKPVEEMTPWYKGFNGTVEKDNRGGYSIYGKVDYDKENNTCHIEELPVGKCIEGYHKLLKSKSIVPYKNSSKPLIAKFEKTGDARTVSFNVEFNPENAPADNEDCIKKLDLNIKISIDNMHLYNIHDQIQKFDSAEKILEQFYDARLNYYDNRKTKMLNNLKSCLSELRDTIDFIRLVRNVKFDFFTKDRQELQNYFRDLRVRVTAICPEKSVGCEYGMYQYLLSLPLSTFFDENLKKLEAKESERQAEMDALSNKSNIQMWEDDLKAFETEWNKEEESCKSNVMDQQEIHIEEDIYDIQGEVDQQENQIDEGDIQGEVDLREVIFMRDDSEQENDESASHEKAKGSVQARGKSKRNVGPPKHFQQNFVGLPKLTSWKKGSKK